MPKLRHRVSSRLHTPGYVVAEIDEQIRIIRGERVILDSDLARLYGVATRVLKQGVRRNPEKFPKDFVLEFSPAEASRMQPTTPTKDAESRSQSVILKRGENAKYRPFAFTEHGAIMAANILNSPQVAPAPSAKPKPVAMQLKGEKLKG